MASRLERMISASTFKRSKPDPAVYLYTAEQMGLQPEECLVIEDSTVGITAGHCAGVKFAGGDCAAGGENSGFEVKFELSKFRDSLRKV